MSRDLQNYDWLSAYEPPVATRVHAGNGALMAEYARERRLFLPIQAVPDRVKAAFLSAEDKNFYNHPGIDRSEEHTSELQSLMRISYAVFCLKKKKKNKHHNTTNDIYKITTRITTRSNNICI